MTSKKKSKTFGTCFVDFFEKHKKPNKKDFPFDINKFESQLQKLKKLIELKSNYFNPLLRKEVNSLSKDLLVKFYKPFQSPDDPFDDISKLTKFEIVNFISSKLIGEVPELEKRKIEKDQISELEEERFFDFPKENLSIPIELIRIIFSFCVKDYDYLCSVGLVNSSWYLQVLRTWDFVSINRGNMRKIPILVLNNVKMVELSEELLKKDFKYILNNVICVKKVDVTYTTLKYLLDTLNLKKQKFKGFKRVNQLIVGKRFWSNGERVDTFRLFVKKSILWNNFRVLNVRIILNSYLDNKGIKNKRLFKFEDSLNSKKKIKLLALENLREIDFSYHAFTGGNQINVGGIEKKEHKNIAISRLDTLLNIFAKNCKNLKTFKTQYIPFNSFKIMTSALENIEELEFSILDEHCDIYTLTTDKCSESDINAFFKDFQLTINLLNDKFAMLRKLSIASFGYIDDHAKNEYKETANTYYYLNRIITSIRIPVLESIVVSYVYFETSKYDVGCELGGRNKTNYLIDCVKDEETNISNFVNYIKMFEENRNLGEIKIIFGDVYEVSKNESICNILNSLKKKMVESPSKTNLVLNYSEKKRKKIDKMDFSNFSVRIGICRCN